MKLVFLFITVFLTVFAKPADRKDPLSLDFIRDYPIKIDGGCSFYTYDTTAFSKHKDILVVSAQKIAFVERGDDFVLLHHVKRILKPNGYTDYFAEPHYKIKLDVNLVKKVNDYAAEYAGSLELSHGKNSKTIAVHGRDEEYNLRKLR